MKQEHIDLLLKYCLALAGEEDWGNRELGPIHLIKYVYLADLAFAERYQGRTFSGVTWKFYNYGPWSLEIYQRIKPIVLATGAEERSISTKYEDDTVRWSLCDSHLCKELERQLPIEITSILKRSIHRFGADTSELLNYVYMTSPMLNAAPGDILSFSPQNSSAQKTDMEAAGQKQSNAHSYKEEKRRKKKLQDLRERVQKALHKMGTKKLVSPSPKPRYDEMFFEGQKWLEDIAGAEIKPCEGELLFSEKIWLSPARREPNVS